MFFRLRLSVSLFLLGEELIFLEDLSFSFRQSTIDFFLGVARLFHDFRESLQILELRYAVGSGSARVVGINEQRSVASLSFSFFNHIFLVACSLPHRLTTSFSFRFDLLLGILEVPS